METWKDIPGAEGRYQASSRGRIGDPENLKIIDSFDNNRGNRCVSLDVKGVSHTMEIKDLVIRTFGESGDIFQHSQFEFQRFIDQWKEIQRKLSKASAIRFHVCSLSGIKEYLLNTGEKISYLDIFDNSLCQLYRIHEPECYGCPIWRSNSHHPGCGNTAFTKGILPILRKLRFRGNQLIIPLRIAVAEWLAFLERIKS